jgi:hypothetical protein
LVQAHLLVVLGLVFPLARARLVVEVVEAENHQVAVCFLVEVAVHMFLLVLSQHYQQAL